jgi:phosphocarrier protein
MVSKKLIIRYPSGLELEQAGAICKKAVQYKSLITFAYPDGTANVKSVLSVLGSCVRGGDEVELFCDGVDEVEALQALAELITGGGNSL